VVTRGQSDVREDAFTGESLPRAVAPGDAIYAGTINTGQPLEARVSGDYRESRLALLLRSVQTAQGARPALATLADRVAGYFVGAILLVATVTAVAWLQIDPDKALWVTLSVLVISCPCALALATPAALTAAAGALRDRGIIVNAENALETLVRTTHLVFDKTGTLTEGDLSIDTVLPVGSLCEQDVIQLASALQQQSAHPVARAFAGIDTQLDVHEVVHCQGAGVEARHEGAAVRMGSEAFCRQIAPQLSPPPDKPLYWVALVRADEPLAWIGFSDRLRDDAPAVVDAARDRGLTVQLLTGDGSAQAAHVAKALKIEDVHAGCSPQQKLAHVQALQEEGAVVCMVGDGLNDAPVLSAADVSIAVAGATELARTQASLVITDGGLHRVEEAQQIARQAYRVMRQNIGWALGYNACAIPLAAAGMVAPWVAALGMSASSLLVVLNALRLSRSAGG
jgi:Cu2+-exporting ATPase